MPRACPVCVCVCVRACVRACVYAFLYMVGERGICDGVPSNLL